jgi:hypothetical protein
MLRRTEYVVTLDLNTGEYEMDITIRAFHLIQTSESTVNADAVEIDFGRDIVRIVQR